MFLLLFSSCWVFLAAAEFAVWALILVSCSFYTIIFSCCSSSDSIYLFCEYCTSYSCMRLI